MDDLEEFRAGYANTMQNMFAAVSELYARYWGEFFHFALFDDHESLDDAFSRTHQRYIADLGVTRSSRILDLACGRGAFAEVLAGATEGQVVGVDISRAQLARARMRARPNLEFREHDIMRLDELSDRFDAVSFLDAGCYLPDRGEALGRIARVMRPGARLLLVDWCEQEGLTALQEELVLVPFMRDWAISSLETRSGYLRHLAGDFRILAVEDLNDRVAPNWERGYQQGLQAVRELAASELPPQVADAVQADPTLLQYVKDQFDSVLYIKAAFDLGFLRYIRFVAERK